VSGKDGLGKGATVSPPLPPNSSEVIMYEDPPETIFEKKIVNFKMLYFYSDFERIESEQIQRDIRTQRQSALTCLIQSFQIEKELKTWKF
jgi:hypothetical protein